MTLKRLLATATSAIAMVSAPLVTAVPLASADVPLVTEHYMGNTYILTPTNWHGATDCAITSPTEAYCFDTDAAFAAFTSNSSSSPSVSIESGASPRASAEAVGPNTSGTCDGFVKIWNGVDFTNRGLAFEDYGSQQSLADYTQVPFRIKSWFTDGQRGYYPMTNCHAFANDPDGITLHTNAEAKDLGTGYRVSYITLSKGVG